jgi:hypothetical protein
MGSTGLKVNPGRSLQSAATCQRCRASIAGSQWLERNDFDDNRRARESLDYADS